MNMAKPKEKTQQEIHDEWHDDPANWKMGLFYFNPKDKRIFPPKRVKGWGRTINFANPYSIIVAILCVGVIYGLLKFFDW